MSRLDRLSALLEGLLPEIVVRHAGPLTASQELAAGTGDFLHLHLLLDGQQKIRLFNASTVSMRAPSMALLRSDRKHTLAAAVAGEPHQILCIEAHFAGPAAPLLLAAFAEPLLIDLDEHSAELGLVLRLIASELLAPRCGQPAMLHRAGEMLFIGVLRHLISQPRTPVGMLNGLAEPRIARALVAFHTQPAVPWPLEALAEAAGMSRTAFATRFRDLMGTTPGDYVMQLRLGMARREIALGHGLKRAAQLAGYASSAALSRALARRRGVESSGASA